MKKVVVVGSINMDLVTTLSRVPVGGETMFGNTFSQIPGGKGANQAVAIGKILGNATMLGMVGKDSFGKDLIKSLNAANVDTSHVEEIDSPSGIANILVEENGQNRIIVVAGANACVDKAYIDRHIDAIKTADIVVLQLEIPISTVSYVLEVAKKFGKTTILNPAPATTLSDEIIKNSDIIIPNETELELITGIKTDTIDGIKEAGFKLFKMGVKSLIVTLGSKGSMYMDDKEIKFVTAYKVEAIDTTAAGDSFIGGFITKLEKDNFVEAIEFGTKVSAIAVTRRGAQTSIPTYEEVINFKGVKNEEN